MKKRDSIVAWRETDLALSVVVFNEILRSRTVCVFTVNSSLKCTDGQGVALPRIFKENLPWLLQYASEWESKNAFSDWNLQIAFMHMRF